MESKLTLRLDREIIDRAKEYAQEKNISLSKLIENMLSRVTNKDTFNTEITPLVESLSGIIKSNDKDDDYGDYLSEKYK